MDVTGDPLLNSTADTLADWWTGQTGGRAVLILDALSLRELPWILYGAKERGYTVHGAKATAAELPADTTPFAKGARIRPTLCA